MDVGRYFLIVSTFVPVYMWTVVPRYRERHVLVYITLCSAIASVTVVASRTFSSILTDALADGDFEPLFGAVPFVSLVLIAVTAVWSVHYLNKARVCPPPGATARSHRLESPPAATWPSPHLPH